MLAWWYDVQLESGEPGFNSRFPRESFSWTGQTRLVTEKLVFQCPRCQAPGVVGSALGLVDPASVN